MRRRVCFGPLRRKQTKTRVIFVVRRAVLRVVWPGHGEMAREWCQRLMYMFWLRCRPTSWLVSSTSNGCPEPIYMVVCVDPRGNTAGCRCRRERDSLGGCADAETSAAEYPDDRHPAAVPGAARHDCADQLAFCLIPAPRRQRQPHARDRVTAHASRPGGANSDSSCVAKGAAAAARRCARGPAHERARPGYVTGEPGGT
jgi:hypothetical protein